MQKKVSDLIAEFLKEKDISCVFGIIGSGNAHIFDSIYSLGFTEIVCVHHEQAAVMAMGAYYRTSGKMSAALLTTGAGSLNGVTGVVSLWMDSVPGLIISGNENSKFTTSENPLRIWGIQGYDSPKMVQDHTKFAKRLVDETETLRYLNEAYNESLSGRPGPVWLDVPMNIQAKSLLESALTEPGVDFKKFQDSKKFESTPEAPNLNSAVQKILADLNAAERPVVWLGHGIRLAGAVELIEPLLKTLNTPALISWAGIDMISSEHPSVFGRAGIYGQRSANFVLQNCDYLLTIGTRLAIPQVGYDIAELARGAKEIAVVDIDLAEATKYRGRVTLPICADAKDFMQVLLEEAQPAAEKFSEKYASWWQRCRTFKKDFPAVGPEHKDVDGYINSYPFMQKLSQKLPPEAILVTDMGTALLSGHQVLSLEKGQRLMTSTGLGEMGYGLPAAMGACFANDRRPVICLNCDGGMMMNLQELQTIRHHKLPLKVIIFNNDGYLMIKHTQKALFKGRYSGTNEASGVTCPNFESLAKAFEYGYFKVKTWEDVEAEIPKAFERPGPVFIEVFMHPEQLLVPKLALAPQKDGSIISPPLEDLSPFLPRHVIEKNMIVPVHPKSKLVEDVK